MAIAANDSLIVNKEGAPIDARTVAPTLAALTEIENPYVGLHIFVTATGKEYRVTEIEDVAVGAFTKKQIKTYEALPDADDLTQVEDAVAAALEAALAAGLQFAVAQSDGDATTKTVSIRTVTVSTDGSSVYNGEAQTVLYDFNIPTEEA